LQWIITIAMLFAQSNRIVLVLAVCW